MFKFWIKAVRVCNKQDITTPEPQPRQADATINFFAVLRNFNVIYMNAS